VKLPWRNVQVVADEYARRFDRLRALVADRFVHAARAGINARMLPTPFLRFPGIPLRPALATPEPDKPPAAPLCP